MNAKLTAKEIALMSAVAHREFSFFDDGISEGSGIWADCMTGEIVGSTKYPVSETRRGVASVLNSLVRKGLLQSENDDESDEGAWTYLTAEGVAWCEAHTAEAPAAETAEAPAEVVAEAAPAAFAKGDAVIGKDGERFTVRRINANGTIRLIDELGNKINRKAETLTKA